MSEEHCGQMSEDIAKIDLLDKPEKRWYFSIKSKFFLSMSFALVWLAFSIILARGWFDSLSRTADPFIAGVIIAGVALIPGFMNALLVASLVLDRQPKLKNIHLVKEPVTVLIAAYNEESSIYDTLKYVANQSYQGPISVLVVDNGSTDETAQEARRAAHDFHLNVEVLLEKTKGKYNALNAGLAHIKTRYFIGLDADTLLHKDSIAYLVARALVAPHDVVAVAGSMLVRNSRDNMLAKLQEWDYFLSIASVKRMQGMYQGTLVAQGAFSLYCTESLRALGGWPNAIGEDIVVTWRLLAANKKVFFEPLAVAFTSVPTTLVSFLRQRSRWARGLFEGIRAVRPWKQPSIYQKVSTGINLFIPYVDVAYTIFWVPGLILAVFFHDYAVVGPMFFFVLPLTLISFGILFFYQRNVVFKTLGLKLRQNIVGFVLFMLVYQMLMSPISIYGYVQELFRAEHRWK